MNNMNNTILGLAYLVIMVLPNTSCTEPSTVYADAMAQVVTEDQRDDLTKKAVQWADHTYELSELVLAELDYYLISNPADIAYLRGRKVVKKWLDDNVPDIDQSEYNMLYYNSYNQVLTLRYLVSQGYSRKRVTDNMEKMDGLVPNTDAPNWEAVADDWIKGIVK